MNEIESLPFYIVKGIFYADVPYKLEGWENSIDLTKENKKQLFDELIQWNEKLINIYRNSDIDKYNEIYKKRKTDFNIVFYAKKNSLSSVGDAFHSKFKDLITLSNDNYGLVFYANGKLVSLKLPYKLPGFTFEPKVKNEDSLGISLIIFFHRLKPGAPLEVIR
ncbi:MAG TPA: hypothetical protein VF677_10095 [Flavobacterium sp.]